MKALITAIFLITLAGGANALELQKMGAGDVAAAQTSVDVPLPAAGNKYAGSEIEEAYKAIENEYYSAKSEPANWDIAGAWEGRVFNLDSSGRWNVRTLNISFQKTTSPSDLGPLFTNTITELYVTFPYYATVIESKLSKEANAMKFKFRADTNYEVIFRQFERGQTRHLSMRTDAFGGTSYGYFYKKQAHYTNLPLNEYH